MSNRFFLIFVLIFFHSLSLLGQVVSHPEIEKNLNMADSLLEIEQFEESFHLYTKVLKDAEVENLKELKACALKGLGNIELLCGDLKKAKVYYKDALNIFKEVGDKRGEVKIFNNLGIVSEEENLYDEAMSYYRKSLLILKASGYNEIEDRKDEVALLGNIGHLFEVSIDLDSAVFYYGKAYELAREIEYLRGEADVLHNIGNIYHRMSEYDSAKKYYETSKRIFEAMGNRKGVADNLGKLGAVERKQGHYGEAILLLDQALKYFKNLREGGLFKGEAEILNTLALVYQEIGKYNKALDYLKEIKELYEIRNDTVGIAIAMENIGNSYFELSESKKEYSDSALTYFEKSIEIFKRKNKEVEEANGLNNKGLVYQRLGKIDKALSLYNEALKVYSELKNTIGQAKACSNIGNIYMIKKDYIEAIRSYEKAISLIGELNLPEFKATSLASLGIAYRNADKIQESIEVLEKAISIVENIRGELVTQEFKSSFIEDKIRIYEELIEILLENGRIEEAFLYIERGKARALLDIIGQKTIKIKKLPDDVRDLVQEEKVLSRKVELLTDQEQKMEAFVEHQRILKELKNKYPEYHSLKVVEPIDLKGLQRMLDNKTIILEYFLCHKGVFLFAIDERNVSAQKLDYSPEELYEDVDWLRKYIYSLEGWESLAYKLYEKLIMVVEEELKGKERVCIVPHGVLHHLPFNALLINKDPQTFFIEQYDLFYSPSSSILKIAHDKNKRRKKKSLLFAKSDFSDYPGWGNLDGTIEEVEKLRSQRLLPGIKVYTDVEATEGKLKEVARKYDIIHLATHGELNRENPLLSRILLSSSRNDDGSLTVSEIFGLDLSCYLVTLSACETGKIGSYVPGKEFSSGDDLVGLTRAFIFAGTPSIIASLWHVGDAPAVLLMERFYKEMKKGDKAKSICEAQRYMIKESDYPSPRFWAPFVLFGDWE